MVDELVNTIEELNEDRTSLVVPVPFVKVTQSALKHMPEREPILLYEYLKSLNRPIVRIQHYLCESAQLSSPIPTISAVHKYVYSLESNGIKNVIDS